LDEAITGVVREVFGVKINFFKNRSTNLQIILENSLSLQSERTKAAAGHSKQWMPERAWPAFFR
jgi:hypothetical protein